MVIFPLHGPNVGIAPAKLKGVFALRRNFDASVI